MASSQGPSHQPDIIAKHMLLRILIGLLVIISAFYTLSSLWGIVLHFGDIILMFFLAWILSFTLSPIADALQSFKLSRTLSAALVYLWLGLIIVLVVILVVPTIKDQILKLATDVQAVVTPDNLNILGNNVLKELQRLGMTRSDANQLISQVKSNVPQIIQGSANAIVQNTTNIFESIVTFLLDTTIVLILSFYMMLDGRKLAQDFTNMMPSVWKSDVTFLGESIEKIFGGFIRGQLLLGLIYGGMTWITLLILHLQNGLLISILSGLSMLIPFIGPFVAIVPAVLLGLIEAAPDNRIRTLVILVVMLIIWQQVVMQLLAPRILGRSVGMHPLLVFAALLIGAKEAGAWGAFFGIPIAAVLYAMFRVFFRRFTELSPLYQQEEIEASDQTQSG